MSTDGGRGPAQGPYRTQRPGQNDPNPSSRPPLVEPDATLPPGLNELQRTALPPGTKWAKTLTHVHQAARRAEHYEGVYLSGAVRLVAGAVVLTCSRDDQLRVYVYMPENIWHRTNQPDVAHRDGWPRLLRAHCRGWVAMSRAERILRACREAILELDRGLETTDDLSERTAFTQARQHYEQISAYVTGEVTELTHSGLVAALDAWLMDVAAHSGADRDVVLTMLTEALEAEESTDRELGGDNQTPINRDDPYHRRIAALYRVMTRLNLTVADAQRFYDLAEANDNLTVEEIATEAERRHRVDSAFGTQTGRTSSSRPSMSSGPRRSPRRRTATQETPTEAPPRTGALTRLARSIRIRQRRRRDVDDDN